MTISTSIINHPVMADNYPIILRSCHPGVIPYNIIIITVFSQDNGLLRGPVIVAALLLRNAAGISAAPGWFSVVGVNHVTSFFLGQDNSRAGVAEVQEGIRGYSRPHIPAIPVYISSSFMPIIRASYPAPDTKRPKWFLKKEELLNYLKSWMVPLEGWRLLLSCNKYIFFTFIFIRKFSN
jgi:hypothetical protein